MQKGELMQKLFDEIICPNCKKMFICWDRGAWKYKKTINGFPRFFCKWSCYNNYQIEAAEKEKNRRKAAGERRRRANASVQQVQEVRKETDGS